MESRIFQISWNFYGSGFRDTEYKTRSLVHDKVTASAAARTRLLFRFVRNPSTAMHFHWPLAAEAFIFPVLKMHRGLARALFSIKQNVASLDATFYYAPCRYHVVDKLQSAFRSTSSSPFFLFYFFPKRISILIFIVPLTQMFQFQSILERNLRLEFPHRSLF